MGQGSTSGSGAETSGAAGSWVIGVAGTAAVAALGVWIFLHVPLPVDTQPQADLVADLQLGEWWTAGIHVAATWAAVMLVLVWATASVYPRMVSRHRAAMALALPGAVLASCSVPAFVLRLGNAEAVSGVVLPLLVFPLAPGVGLLTIAALVWVRGRW